MRHEQALLHPKIATSLQAYSLGFFVMYPFLAVPGLVEQVLSILATIGASEMCM